jgi:hypothetical protein
MHVCKVVLRRTGFSGDLRQISSVVFVYWRRAIFGVVVLLDWIGAGVGLAAAQSLNKRRNDSLQVAVYSSKPKIAIFWPGKRAKAEISLQIALVIAEIHPMNAAFRRKTIQNSL